MAATDTPTPLQVVEAIDDAPKTTVTVGREIFQDAEDRSRLLHRLPECEPFDALRKDDHITVQAEISRWDPDAGEDGEYIDETHKIRRQIAQVYRASDDPEHGTFVVELTRPFNQAAELECDGLRTLQTTPGAFQEIHSLPENEDYILHGAHFLEGAAPKLGEHIELVGPQVKRIRVVVLEIKANDRDVDSKGHTVRITPSIPFPEAAEIPVVLHIPDHKMVDLTVEGRCFLPKRFFCGEPFTVGDRFTIEESILGRIVEVKKVEKDGAILKWDGEVVEPVELKFENEHFKTLKKGQSITLGNLHPRSSFHEVKLGQLCTITAKNRTDESPLIVLPTKIYERHGRIESIQFIAIDCLENEPEKYPVSIYDDPFYETNADAVESLEETGTGVFIATSANYFRGEANVGDRHVFAHSDRQTTTYGYVTKVEAKEDGVHITIRKLSDRLG